MSATMLEARVCICSPKPLVLLPSRYLRCFFGLRLLLS